jgi:hypothetical protein
MAEKEFPKVLFARVGWMKRYSGSRPGDEKPYGGGKWNKQNKGGELHNFAEAGGQVYGYFQPSMASDTVRMDRIDPAAHGESLSGVLIVWVARGRVVGWYENATVYREARKLKGAPSRLYRCKTAAKSAVLLPVQARTLKVPQQQIGGFGQSNVRYTHDARNGLDVATWMRDVLLWVRSYKGPSVLTDPYVEAEDAIQDAVAGTVEAGQGFRVNAAQRRAIERHAVNKAITHYKDTYSIEERGKPFDLLCTKGKKKLYVEVKGVTGSGEKLIVTRNEVAFAEKNRANMVLFVVHSINVKGTKHPKASGGTVVRQYPWVISAKSKALTPLAYTLAL